MSFTSARIRALLVDDDAEIGILLCKYLEKFDIHCTAVGDGSGMREALSHQTFDVVLLDLMLPGEDGLTLLRHVRNKSNIPVIMLTARGESSDKILGLELGADDYVVKPFDTRELVARMQSVIRRAQTEAKNQQLASENEIHFQGWKLHCPSRQLLSPQKLVVPLSNSEYKLLRAFLAHPKQILTRDQLLELAIGKSSNSVDRSIDLMVSRLRQKLNDDPRQPSLLETVRGEGYVFSASL